jgi:thymidine kinase
MNKLYFRYGAMGCGKTMQLLQVAFNYEERGQKVAVIKPLVDKKAGDSIITRIGPTRKVDQLITPRDDLYELITKKYPKINCLLVDEAQFFTKAQINQLHKVAALLDIPVIAYGLRCDSFQEAWPGSRRLLEIADKVEEIKTICDCGRKATMNCRLKDGRLVLSGPKILIDDGAKDVVYKSVCPRCYYGLMRE